MTPTDFDLVNRVHKLLSEASVLVDEIAQQKTPDRTAPSNQKKLTKREVGRIREMKRNGFTQKAIADIFDVHPVTISRIVRGQYWK